MSEILSKNIRKQIGIIYSPGYGAGWSTWGKEEMALDQELANAISSGSPAEQIRAIATKNWPDEYMGGLGDCKVEWVDEGTLFKINEYDGYESLEIGYCEFISARDCTPTVLSGTSEMAELPVSGSTD